MRIRTAKVFIQFLFLLVLGWIALSSFEAQSPSYNPYFQERAKQFRLELQKLEGLSDSAEKESLIAQYRICRFVYKSLELFPVYFTDVTEKSLNGPLVPEVEDFDPLNQVLPPQGLQVVESIIWDDHGIDRELLKKEVQRCLGSAFKLVQISNSQEMADWQIFDDHPCSTPAGHRYQYRRPDESP